MAACSAAIVFAAAPSAANSIDLTSGTSGTLTGVPQSFNETRGIDVTVLSATPVHVGAMTLDGLVIGSASSAFVGARIYTSGGGSLLATSNGTVLAGGSVTVPISADLAPGGTYRISFFVATTPASQGAATLFDPSPAGGGGFPYTESTGQLRIDGAYALAADAFPTNVNIFVPQVRLDVAPRIDMTTGTSGALTGVPQSFNETRGVDVTVLASSVYHLGSMRLDGLFLGSATSALVAARVYASGSGSLVASADTTVSTGGSVTVPIRALLVPGATYRVSFFVATTPSSQGSGTFFDPAPAGVGGFPYIEDTGQFRIDGAFALAADAFPTNINIFVPQIRLIEQTQPGISFCFGDGSGVPCPCGNSGSPGHGCQNSSSTGGALLTGTGVGQLSADSVQLTSSYERPTALSIFLQGNTTIVAVPYGDGLRCAGGALKRLFVKSAIGGVVLAPQGGDPTFSARSAALGDPIPATATRVYQVYYRDPSPSFCASPMGSTFNASNAIAVTWQL